MDDAITNDNISAALALLGVTDQGVSFASIKFDGQDPLGARVILQDEDGTKLLNQTTDNVDNTESPLANAIK